MLFHCMGRTQNCHLIVYGGLKNAFLLYTGEKNDIYGNTLTIRLTYSNDPNTCSQDPVAYTF